MSASQPLVPDSPPPTPTPGARNSAIGKVMSVLEALTSQERISDVVRATGMSTSTVHRILSELVELGWAHYQDHRYSPGARAIALVERLDTNGAMARIARPPLRRLNERTGFTVHLAVLHGYDAVYASKLEGRQAYVMRSRIGDSLALHSTAIGKAILAQMPERQVAQIAEHTGLEAFTEATIADLPRLSRHLDDVRRQGWAVDDGENEVNVRCVGAAICNSQGQPVAGVSVSALRFDMTTEVLPSMAALVVATARQISAALER